MWKSRSLRNLSHVDLALSEICFIWSMETWRGLGLGLGSGSGSGLGGLGLGLGLGLGFICSMETCMFLSWSAAHTGKHGSADQRSAPYPYPHPSPQAPQWAWAWRGADRSGWAGLGWAGGACRLGRRAGRAASHRAADCEGRCRGPCPCPCPRASPRPAAGTTRAGTYRASRSAEHARTHTGETWSSPTHTAGRAHHAHL